MSLDQLKQEVLSEPQKVLVRNQLKNIGYRAHLNQPNVLARAYALEAFSPLVRCSCIPMTEWQVPC